MGIESLQQEIAYFEKIKQQLLKTNRNQFALIKDQKLIGTFTTLQEAYEAGVQRFQDAAFLVKPIVEQEQYQSIPAVSATKCPYLVVIG